MDMNQQMRLERDCERLSVDYVRHADFQDFDSFAELFTEDGVLEIQEVQRRGHDEIKQHFRNRPQMVTRHICTNHWIEPVDDDHARGMVYLTVYRIPGPFTEADGPIPCDGPTWIGHYEDAYVRTPRGWRFASRKLHIRFRFDE
jgi:hypothetical protein